MKEDHGKLDTKIENLRTEMKEDHGKLGARLERMSEQDLKMNGMIHKIAGHLFGVRDIVLDDVGENGGI